MGSTVAAWMIAIPLLGVATGARSMTPIAVVCWFAHLGLLPVDHTWAFWTANLASVIVFTALALGEYIGDKLPKTPNRIAPGPLASPRRLRRPRRRHRRHRPPGLAHRGHRPRHHRRRHRCLRRLPPSPLHHQSQALPRLARRHPRRLLRHPRHRLRPPPRHRLALASPSANRRSSGASSPATMAEAPRQRYHRAPDRAAIPL